MYTDSFSFKRETHTEDVFIIKLIIIMTMIKINNIKKEILYFYISGSQILRNWLKTEGKYSSALIFWFKKTKTI